MAAHYCDGQGTCKTCQMFKSKCCHWHDVVYLITSAKGKKYVGITTATLGHRMSQHHHAIKAGHGDGEKFIKYYQKKERFEDATVTVLYHGRSNKYLRQKEREFIIKYDSIRNGLNSEL